MLLFLKLGLGPVAQTKPINHASRSKLPHGHNAYLNIIVMEIGLVDEAAYSSKGVYVNPL